MAFWLRVARLRQEMPIAISWPTGAKILEPCNRRGAADLGNFPVPPVPVSRPIQAPASSSANASYAGVFGRKLDKARSGTRAQIRFTPARNMPRTLDDSK